MKVFFIGIGALIATLAIVFALQGFSLASLKFWGPQFEDARREIFEETKSYNHGMIRDLENLCMQYQVLESQSHRDAVAATIRHRKSAFTGDLPLHVRKCLNSIN